MYPGAINVTEQEYQFTLVEPGNLRHLEICKEQTMNMLPMSVLLCERRLETETIHPIMHLVIDHDT